MSSEVLKKFGRYFLLDLIAQGGMAEIYRARLASRDGFGRLVVVKRIQAGFGGNNEFLQMFKSEIKVTMGFNHQNIVQVYDFGEEQGQPFITMELVDGKNLRQLLNRFKEVGQPFPVELAATVVEQAACGLFYAHSFKDKISGEPLHIVHRDISPQNILVSYEGGVKIIDFGIAKATTNSEHTRAGVIKGKPSYLAPEQISGDPLDGRTDLFALGTVFWELLVGKKLFQGENDLAVLKMIESCTATVRPPSELNPNVPKDLDQIIMKLLSKSPEKRYQSGEELSRSLRRFLHAYAPDFSSSDLSSVSKELFQKEIVEDRKKIQRLNERVEQLLQNEVPEIAAAPDEPPGAPKREETTTFVARHHVAGLPKQPVEFKVEEVRNEPVLPVEKTVQAPVPRGNTKHIQPAPGTGAYQPMGYTRSSSSRTGSFSRPDSGGGFGAFKSIAAAVIAVVGLSWAAPKYMDFEIPVVSSLFGFKVPDRHLACVGCEVKPSPEPMDVPSSSKPAKLRLNIFPEGKEGKISVNGRFVDPAKPMIDVPTDSPLELMIQRPGFAAFRSEFKIDTGAIGSDGLYVKEISLTPEAVQDTDYRGDTGFLSVASTPGADVRIYVDGKPFKAKTTPSTVPFEMVRVPVGKVSLHLYNATLDLEDQITIDIEKNKTKQVQANLKPKKR